MIRCTCVYNPTTSLTLLVTKEHSKLPFWATDAMGLVAGASDSFVMCELLKSFCKKFICSMVRFKLIPLSAIGVATEIWAGFCLSLALQFPVCWLPMQLPANIPSVVGSITMVTPFFFFRRLLPFCCRSAKVVFESTIFWSITCFLLSSPLFSPQQTLLVAMGEV